MKKMSQNNNDVDLKIGEAQGDLKWHRERFGKFTSSRAGYIWPIEFG